MHFVDRHKIPNHLDENSAMDTYLTDPISEILILSLMSLCLLTNLTKSFDDIKRDPTTPLRRVQRSNFVLCKTAFDPY